MTLLRSQAGNCDIGEVKHGVSSGTLIRADVAVKACCRDESCIDQADYDLISESENLDTSRLV